MVARGGSFDQLAQIFDALEAATLAFVLIDLWKGAEIPTGHSTDDMLGHLNWYGVECVSMTAVHPLVITFQTDGTIFRADPAKTLADVDPAQVVTK